MSCIWNFRKLQFFLMGLMLPFAFSSCSYDDSDLWDSVNDLDNRVSQLEKLCDQFNANLQSIQIVLNSIQDNDFITSATPITENGTELGYTISFAKQSPINLYHGRAGSDGTSGKDGIDGYTPKIGVKEGEDGHFYWTLDGEWLTDENGNNILAQRNGGNDESNDSNASHAADGITPKLKIDDGCWYVSYDNGNAWTFLGKATGNDGVDGADGDSMFKSVEYTEDGDYVLIVFSDKTTLQLPTWKAYVALKSVVEQLNVNLNSLQTIVTAKEENDYIKAVTPITNNNNVPIGYTITFAKADPITIYHGKNGSDGKDGSNGLDGKDGYIPQISVKKYLDGTYYWTLDGDWLTDEVGDKIKAQGVDGSNGNDGVNGNDGAPGENGSDGITPKLKIEGGYWCISYDEGATWSSLGKATGENGTNGDSMFSGIDYKSSNDFVTFTLADGSEIKFPTYEAFEKLQVKLNQANTNLEALKTLIDALDNQDWITGVSAVSENGKIVGYTISFAKGSPVIIYNGTDGSDGQDGKDGADGKDGTDGKDGYVPSLSVSQATDGLYYWTIDGEWMLDSDGNKICAQGRDGSDGADGNSGDSGVTPKLKIDEGYWYVSYDEGQNWTQLGKAVGENGQNGADGKDGSSITITQDANNVYFELEDGSTITISKSDTSGGKIEVKFSGMKNNKITLKQSNLLGSGTPYEITSGFVSGETTLTQEMVSYSSSYITSSNIGAVQENMARHSVCSQKGTIVIYTALAATYKIKVTITNGNYTKIEMLTVVVEQ